MKLDIVNEAKEKVGDIEVSDEVFGAEVKPHLHHVMVRYQMARRRRGTHATLNRKNVTGSTRKLFRQKGTGRARHGDIKAPIYRGGGIVFGPQPRDYSFKVPSKVRRGALRSALSEKVAQGRLIVVDKLEWDTPRTKRAVATFGALQVRRVLVVDGDNDALRLSVRNLPDSKFLRAEGVNVYDVLNHDYLVITAAALRSLDGALKS